MPPVRVGGLRMVAQTPTRFTRRRRGMIALVFLLGAVIFSPLPEWVKIAAVVLFLIITMRRR